MAKRNIWKDPSPYGTYEGERGNPEQWKCAFQFAWDEGTARIILEEEKKEWWQILGVSVSDVFKTVEKKFKDLMKKNHPDKGGDKELCQKIISAWVIAKKTFGK